MNGLPDFIIIGAMKCATTTLHAQLAHQPGFFLSEPKEPNFFSNDEIYARGMDWYRGLFAGAPPGALCGESSTHYTKLPTYPRTIERMTEHVPGAKLIYVMRHPIDRLVSQYVHEWTQRVISTPIDDALDDHPELIDYSRYAMQLRPFLDTHGRSRVLPVFFDNLGTRPQAELERVCRFLGHAGTPAWRAEDDAQNTSSERMRRSPLRDAVLNFPPARWARRALVPVSVRERVKALWMMKKRPELSAGNVERLEKIFDEDLAEVGRWLGIELNCRNFKQAAAATPPGWAEAGGGPRS